MEEVKNQKRLHDRFRIGKQLGEGGMGVVYEAFDERRGLTVALKTLLHVSPEGLISLKREFRLAADLRHPNLVRLYDLVVSSLGCSFSMELIKGQDLLTAIRGQSISMPTAVNVPTTGPGYRSPKTPVAWVHDSVGATYDGVRLLRVLPQICAALDTLHQAGLVHRDIKPNNILVTNEGQAKLLDFGIAQSRADREAEIDSDYIPGTPHYMSPEQIRGEQVEAPSDLYSLGVLLYVLLTGRPPFHGKDSTEILRGHVYKTPVPPSKLATGIPSPLEALCLDLLRKDASLRPSARQISKRLASLGAPLPSFTVIRPRSFVGRTKELETLSTIIERVSSGHRQMVLLGGDSGIGKSALCTQVTRMLSEMGWRVCNARCYEREFLPYNAIDPLLDTVATALSVRSQIMLPAGMDSLAAMFPTLLQIPGVERSKESNPTEERKKAKRALGKLLDVYRDKRSLVLWIDDLQWSDQDSVELLLFLLQKSSLPFLLLGTYYYPSEVPSDHPLSSLLEAKEVYNLSLSPFQVEEVRDLVGEDVEDHLVMRIAKEARGNAFLATELGIALLSGESTEGDLNLLFRTRLHSLKDAPRKVLEALGVAGKATSFRVLQTVTRLDAPALCSALDMLRGECWIREVDDRRKGDAYDIYHNRIREVVQKSLSQQNQEALHLIFYETLQEIEDPEVIAEHALRAGKTKEAAPWLLLAARKATSQLAPLRASELYRRTLIYAPPDWPDAQYAREERAKILDRAGGLYQEAASAYRDASQYLTGEAATKLLLLAAEADLKQGDVKEALKTSEQALAPYEKLRLPKSDFRAVCETILRTLWNRFKLNRLHELPDRPFSEQSALRHFMYLRLGSVFTYFDLFLGMLFNARSVSLALASGSNDQVVRALTFHTYSTALRRGRKNFAHANALLNRCFTWQPLTKDPEMAPWVQSFGAMVSTLSGEFQTACQVFPEALEAYRKTGRLAGHEITAIYGYWSVAKAATGKPKDAIKLIEPLFQTALEEQDFLVLPAFAPIMLWNRLLLGDLEGAQVASEAIQWKAAKPAMLSLAFPLRQSALLLAQGHTTKAIETLEHMLETRFRNGLVFLKEYHLRCRIFLSASHLALARHTDSASKRHTSLQRAFKIIKPVLKSDDPVLEGIGFRLAGLIEFARNRNKSAKTWLDRAVLSLEDKGEAFELAAALLARGAINANTNDIAQGQRILQSGEGFDPSLREGNGWSWK